MKKFFGHLFLILRHRHQVIRNASHCGIFFHALKHDLSKFSFKEFFPSVKYFAGDHSPVYEQRMANSYFSSICQHHTRRNPHHWEYWTDFFKGAILVKAMPYKYAVEYVCDMLSASKTYDPKHFSGKTALNYFDSRSSYYYMNSGTREFIRWCLARYAELVFKGLKKKDTLAKYKEISSTHKDVEVITKLTPNIENISVVE